ncbi:sulfite exporter TauE/SafE family protein [Candidatus Formimonas warabiya]|uniref:Probable membrane transporter protein n=1 Tax=Formimonas warabiya TaxID=1761012 RepID=A0A3G1KYC9_FORW1|nr:sulfite exporter TauE/SafE family protein [Candidatus Formimonas warabiya]ATW27513.1 hypothetical protein DCMF_24630 [Candidatus Formimonas warabiya]
MLASILQILLGFAVGTFGTLIGAGGGFILVPVLLLLYPENDPNIITSISLAVVFFNALSGSFAYGRMKKIDYKSGLIFSAASLPGSILGAYATSFIPRHIFDGIFGVLLVALAAFLLTKKTPADGEKDNLDQSNNITRIITDGDGTSYTFSYSLTTGIMVSFLVGCFSSLLGIGGGIIHVPALVNLLNFPVHIATATSHFVLCITAFSGSMVHLFSGTLIAGIHQILFLSIGVLVGAQLGARLSKKIHSHIIMKSLAIALALVGIRIFILAFS